MKLSFKSALRRAQDTPQDSPMDFRYRIQKSTKTDIIGKTTRLGGLSLSKKFSYAGLFRFYGVK